jgi:hypothetical protein
MPESEKAQTTPTPVPASVLQLKIIRRAARVLGTLSTAIAAFLFLFGGVLTLFEFRIPPLNPFVPPVIDIGLVFFGFGLGAMTVGRLAGVSQAAKKTK